MTMKNADCSEFVKKEVNQVTPLLNNYSLFCECLQNILEGARKITKIDAIIQTRTKGISSFAEKCIRKHDKYPQPSYMFTDLCGARLIVESKDQIKVFRDFIEKHFDIDETSAEDVAERLQVHEFGYLSHHFIVSFKDDVKYPGIDKVPLVLLERWDHNEAKKIGLNAGPKYRAEIQIRTLLQHAWATMVHDNLYKTELKKKPRHLERQSGLIAASLEDADNSFVELIKGVRSYQTSFGAYMTPEEIRKEIAIQKVIQEHDENNESLAHKIARLAIAIEDWEVAVKALEPFKESNTAAIRRTLGWATWKYQAQGDNEWLSHLQKATELDPSDADAWCYQGEIFFEQKERRKALERYERAFHEAPDYPRALHGYILCEIVENRNLEFIRQIRPNLKRAIEKSRKLAGYGMHLPWAYYDIGFFTLLLGSPFESLTAYARAVQLTSSMSEIFKIRDYLKEVQHTAEFHPLGEEVKWARWFLNASLVAKAMAHEDECKKMKTEAGNRNLEIEEAENELKKAKNMVSEVLHECIFKGDPRYDDRENLATKKLNNTPLFDKDKSVVILAGGCDIRFKNQIEQYKILIENAFMGYNGVIVSGGTTAGIAGIAGDLPNPENKIKKIAYLPLSIPTTDSKHDGYDEFRQTSKSGYSPLDQIQVWIDILASGIRPDNVRLLGINGGHIAAFEFRMALTMGARVGIFRDSGRAAREILEDPDWNEHPCLFFLPNDQETITAFIQQTEKSTLIPTEVRENMARIAHEKYREEYEKKNPTIDRWEDLADTYKKANRAQVDHNETKLQRIGLLTRRAENPTLYSFSEDQQKILAEMEHGRWNVERFIDGWRLGPEKDEKKKTHPALVSWNKLTPEIRKYDFDIVLKIPQVLAEAGMEIYDPEAENK